jgi:hypothetical protein
MADANAMQAQYEAAWAGAEATHAQGRQLLDALTKVPPPQHRACEWCMQFLLGRILHIAAHTHPLKRALLRL